MNTPMPLPASVADTIATALPQMEGWCTIEKGQRLAQLVYQSPTPPVVVELGVFGGRSLLALALGYQAREDAWTNPCPVHGVDAYAVAADLEGVNAEENAAWWSAIDHDAIYRGCAETLHRYVPGPNVSRYSGAGLWTISKAPSCDPSVLYQYGPRTITLLHQDSNHSEEVSSREIEAWEPRLANDGLWVMDDADWATMQAARARLTARGWVVVEDYTHWVVWGRA